MSYTEIDAQQAEQWLATGEAVLLDVREPGEYRACHIRQAHLSPLGKVSLDGIDVSSKKVIIHCQKGGRGKSACEVLVERHPELDIYNITGGIGAWQAAGLPVNKGKGALPLDRQVQITIGTGVLAGVILSVTVNPNFIWLSGFFGAGLTFAGLSGFCGLAHVMKVMPWNR